MIFAHIGYGGMAEWSKAHDWKSCIRHKRIWGSNPHSSAKMNPTEPVKRLKFGFIFYAKNTGFKFLPSSKRDLNP